MVPTKRARDTHGGGTRRRAAGALIGLALLGAASLGLADVGTGSPSSPAPRAPARAPVGLRLALDANA